MLHYIKQLIYILRYFYERGEKCKKLFSLHSLLSQNERQNSLGYSILSLALIQWKLIPIIAITERELNETLKQLKSFDLSRRNIGSGPNVSLNARYLPIAIEAFSRETYATLFRGEVDNRVSSIGR